MTATIETRVDGARVHTRTADAASTGRDVVFVHGAGLDGSVWDAQLEAVVTAGLRPLAVDLPGHGRSEGPSLHGIDALAGWMPGYMDSVGATSAHLVGHSMGALVVLEVGAVTPERAASLSLLGIAASMAVNPDILDGAERNDARSLEQMRRRMHTREPEPVSGWGPADTFAVMDRAEPGVMFGDLSACNNYGDATVTAGAVDAPTLLLLGGQDVMTRPHAATPIAEVIEESRTVVVHGAGHMLMVERPAEVNEALIQFLLESTVE